MKSILAVLFLVFCTYIAFIRAMDLDNGEYAAIITICDGRKNITADEKQLALRHDLYGKNGPVVPHAVRCYLLCVYKEIGTITAEGTVNKEVLTKLLMDAKLEEKKVKAALEACPFPKDNTDLCDKVYEFGKCLDGQLI